MDRAKMKKQTTEHPPDNRRTSRLPSKLPAGKQNTDNIEKKISLGSNRGVTLIEVLVALTILAIGLLGVALMQVMSITGNTFSKEMAVATELGQDMLEKLRTLEYTDTVEDTALIEGNHPTTDDVNADWAPAVDTDGNATNVLSCNSTTNLVDERGLQVGSNLYIRTWNVVDNSPTTDMKSIAVTVCWQEKGTADRLVTISAVKVQE